MTTYGLTAGGFVRPDFTTIRGELEEDFRAELGIPDLVLQGGKWGRIIDVVASREDKLWQALQGVYDSRTPKGALGVPLDDLCSITGTVREVATKGTVTLRVVGTTGSSVPMGFTAAVTGTGTRWLVTTGGAVATVPAWVTLTPYALGAVVTKGSNVYEATTGGTSGASGPSGTGSSIADGTVVWRFLGAGTGKVDLPAEAEETGPLPASAGTITDIITPVAGVSAVTNPEDAVMGRAREDDPTLRIRREDELRGPGTGAPDAIRARLIKVDDVTAVTIFENTGDVTDGDGLPPHSLEAVVQGGVNADIALALWRAKPAGIYTHGTVSEVVQDAAGHNQTVRFTRPSELAIYVSLTVEKGVAWPSDQADEDTLVADIKASVASYNDTLSLGERVIRNFIFGLARVAGDEVIADIPVLTLGTAPSPVGTTNIQPAARELARLDTSRVVVTLV